MAQDEMKGRKATRGDTQDSGQKTGNIPGSAAPAAPRKDGVQGEGNYDAAREFDEAERKFVASGKVEAAARRAAPKTDAERQEMEAAEQKGRQRAKE